MVQRLKEITEANRRAWNEAASHHRKARFNELLRSFSRPGFSCLDEIETSQLKQIGLNNKSVIQLCCNNGRELLSVKNLGAGRCVGADISDEFILQAEELNSAAGLDCEFVRCDIHDLPTLVIDKFDIVYVTIGAFCWLPDLPPIFKIISRLLRSGGSLFVYDVHPMAEMFEPEDGTDPPQVANSYFRSEPFVDTDGLDYWTGRKYKSAPMYSYLHKLSDIFSGCLEQGLTIRNFTEYEHNISGCCLDRYVARGFGIPLCYILRAVK